MMQARRCYHLGGWSKLGGGPEDRLGSRAGFWSAIYDRLGVWGDIHG